MEYKNKIHDAKKIKNPAKYKGRTGHFCDSKDGAFYEGGTITSVEDGVFYVDNGTECLRFRYYMEGIPVPVEHGEKFDENKAMSFMDYSLGTLFNGIRVKYANSLDELHNDVEEGSEDVGLLLERSMQGFLLQDPETGEIWINTYKFVYPEPDEVLNITGIKSLDFNSDLVLDAEDYPVGTKFDGQYVRYADDHEQLGFEVGKNASCVGRLESRDARGFKLQDTAMSHWRYVYPFDGTQIHTSGMSEPYKPDTIKGFPVITENTPEYVINKYIGDYGFYYYVDDEAYSGLNSVVSEKNGRFIGMLEGKSTSVDSLKILIEKTPKHIDACYFVPITKDLDTFKNYLSSGSSPEPQSSFHKQVLLNTLDIGNAIDEEIKRLNDSIGTDEYYKQLIRINGIGVGVELFGFKLCSSGTPDGKVTSVVMRDKENSIVFELNYEDEL